MVYSIKDVDKKTSVTQISMLIPVRQTLKDCTRSLIG